MSKIRRTVRLVFFGGFLFLSLYTQAAGLREQLDGLVYEVEEWTTPKAWLLNKASGNQWQLWTKEENVFQKRSNGASITTPVLPDKERETPEEGAPPLHTQITGIPNGLYQVFCGPTNRPLAFSFDGITWKRGSLGKNDFGFFEITDNTFEIWVDDRYPSPDNRGWAYYDYIQFIPVEKKALPTIRSLSAFTLPDGSSQLSWISSAPSAPCTVEIDGKTFLEEKSGMRNHCLVVSGLEKGKKYTAKVILPINQKGENLSETIEFEAGYRPQLDKTQKTSVLLTVSETTDAPRKDWPVISGVPFAKGVLANPENVRLLDENGSEVPAQFETFADWEDGSIQWLLCTFRATTRAKTEKAVTYRLETSPEFSSKPGISPVSEENMKKFAHSLKSAVVFADGSETHCNPARFTLVSQGTQAAVLQSVNDFQPKEGEKDFLTGYEMTFFGKEFIRIRSTLVNRELEEPTTLVRSAGVFLPGGKDSPGISILQDTENHAIVKTGNSDAPSEQEHWNGILHAPDGVFFMRDAWQLWPKGMTCGEGTIGFRILPELPKGYSPDGCNELDNLMIKYYWLKEGAYQFKRGMEVRHDFWIVLPDPETGKVREVHAEWLQNPLFATASAEYYCSVGVFPPVHPVREGKWDIYENAFRKSFANLEKGRQERGEYGWMNFGDWYGERQYNWGNNEYDLSYVCALFFARTADTEILTRGIESARHYSTVDRKACFWNPNDREAQYTHCYGHVNHFFTEDDPRVQKLVGALKYNVFRWESDGSGGHTFHPGNYYIACLTGDRYIWNAAASGSWRQAERFTPQFNFSIERSAGWSINNAIYSYRFTHNPYFLNAARIYLECVASKQNPENGCFDLPQDQTECDCPDKKEHRGGKAFAVGILLHSLIRFAETTPDPQERELAHTIIVRSADWLLDESWNEERQGFRYKTGCPQYANSGWYSILVTEGIAYAGEITQNPRYTDFLFRTIPAHLKSNSGSGRASGKEFSQKHRQTPHTLYYLDKVKP